MAVAIHCGRVHLGGCCLGVLRVRVVMGGHDEHGLRWGRLEVEVQVNGWKVTVMMVEITVEEWLMRTTTGRVLGASTSCCRERWKVEIHSFIQKIILNCLVAVTRPHRLVPRYQQVEHSSGSDRGHPPRAVNGGLTITHRIHSSRSNTTRIFFTQVSRSRR